jgi:glycosyltransferase involved in cell wall biosynthesis
MSLNVLSVAYPFAPVGVEPAGAAEQLLAHLDGALVAAGHRSVVVAAAGSRVAGELVPTPRIEAASAAARWLVQCRVREAIEQVLARERIDVIHLHGRDFNAYLPPWGPPALVTLHFPLDRHAPGALRPQRPLTWLQPVSSSQARRAQGDLGLLPPIENGVECARYPRLRKRGFAIVLGRVCRDKGFHHALDASRLAGVPLLVAGTATAWPEQRRYFVRELRPRLDRQRRWIGDLGGRRRRRLLAAARCLLAPSCAPETSCLVAMEALAAGTPVIAYPRGALADIVEHGITGYLVDGVASMAHAIHCAERIDPEACRRRARERFALENTIAAYVARYRTLAELAGAVAGEPRGPRGRAQAHRTRPVAALPARAPSQRLR